MQPSAHMRGEHRVTPDADVERAVARLLEAVVGVAVRGVDGDAVPAGLQREGRVDDEPLRAADTQVRVDDDDVGALEAGHGGSVFLDSVFLFSFSLVSQELDQLSCGAKEFQALIDGGRAPNVVM